MTPAYKITKAYLKESSKERSCTLGISTTRLNSNPTFKKYYYWIYHYNMPYDSAREVFWNDECKLSLKKALNLMDYLQKNNIPYSYVNRVFHRLGTKIFNYEKLKEKYPDIKFAVAYNEDTDEICEEVNNHK